ncbi:NAD-P-binding protein [Trametes maxima]|nr:NAD-P-binding protein [Trametes maxima]
MDVLMVFTDLVKGTLSSHPIISSLTAVLLVHRLIRRLRQCLRSAVLPRTSERVLIVGASSGIGRAIAHEYAKAGSRVCIVARRQQQLNAVAEECAKLFPTPTAENPLDKAGAVLHVRADFNNADEMVALRDRLENEWGGLDTLVVSAGVSALRPLLEVAGVEQHNGKFHPPRTDATGVQRAVSAAAAAIQGNYIGPLVCAVTLIPLLSATSRVPSILLISSVAAVIPAPTRSLYASTKGASLLLYQSLAIEHPSVAFTYVLPGTVEGDFRASAVDGGTAREADPNRHGLKREAVAKRCLRAIDQREKAVFMPGLVSRAGHFIYWLVPGWIEWVAAKKYNYSAN